MGRVSTHNLHALNAGINSRQAAALPKGHASAMENRRTPHHEFWLPILTALVRRGGNATTVELYQDIQDSVALSDYDLGIIEGTVPEPRWKNQVRQAADRMRVAGFLEPSKHGTRAISTEGRVYLEENLQPSGRTEEIVEQSEQGVNTAPSTSSGFGSPESNALVEAAAIAFVRCWYEGRGWRVESVEAERCGFDLRCSTDSSEEHVEVKGVSGEEQTFIITHGEVKRAETDARFVLCVVTAASSETPHAHFHSGEGLIKRLSLVPLQYKATITGQERQPSKLLAAEVTA